MVKEMDINSWVQIVIATLYGGTIWATLYASMKEIKNANRRAEQQSNRMFLQNIQSGIRKLYWLCRMMCLLVLRRSIIRL